MAATRMAITVADQTYHADNLVICLRECLILTVFYHNSKNIKGDVKKLD